MLELAAVSQVKCEKCSLVLHSFSFWPEIMNYFCKFLFSIIMKFEVGVRGGGVFLVNTRFR